jgi:secreted trypsin-like serine protease
MNPNPSLNLSRRSLLSVLAVCVGALASIFATSSQALAASGSNPFEVSGPLVPQIINGKQSSISEFPWQVWILLTSAEGESSCGGSILNATTILTAAHCTDHEGTTTPYNVPSEAEIDVIAGASEGLRFRSESPKVPLGAQQDFVTSVRRDPYYAVTPETKDDVAVLTLEKPLELSPAKNTAAISLVPVGATPAPGTALSVSGFGKQEGAEGEGHNSNGNLYSTSLTAISSDACRGFVAKNSAVLLCAVSATSSTCQGDSGGPLTEGSPAVEVGTVDFGAKECPVNVPDVFTNLAAPEIRDFIEGSETPPVAARSTTAPAIKSVGAAPVDFGPLTCEPGGWTTPPTSYSYTFQVENASAQMLQSGAGNIFTPPSSLVGSPLVCVVQATSPGGTSTARSVATAAIATDTAAPTSAITAEKCVKQTCSLSITASDPNGVALAVTPSAAYAVTAKCPKKKKKKGKKVKQPICHKTKTVPMSATSSSAGVYQAAVANLPYGEKITFSVLASNAAGLKQAKAAAAIATLHKPKPKPKKKPKKKAKKRK